MEEKRKRACRATTDQLNKMLDFFAHCKGLAEGRFCGMHGRLEANKKWEELAELLNSIQGATKTATQWQVVWRDVKSRTSVKARERRKEMAATGNKPVSNELTALDMRVLSIIGPQYVEGSNICADSIPEENALQICLESGDTEVLVASPTVPNILLDEEVVQETDEVVETPDKRRRLNTSTDALASTSKRHQKTKKNVFEAARDQFAVLAKQQADALKMHAEAAKLQAESSMIQANAFNRIAAAVEEIAFNMSTVVETVADKLLQSKSN